MNSDVSQHHDRYARVLAVLKQPLCFFLGFQMWHDLHGATHARMEAFAPLLAQHSP